MILVGQEQRRTRPLGLGRRVRLAAVLALAVVIAAIVYAVASGGSPAVARGCIQVTIPSSTGAAQIHGCGATARALCAAGANASGAVGSSAPTFVAQCRRGGYAVGGG